MSVLNIYRDDGFVAEQVLMRASVSLGRHPENDIVLDDRTLSRFHARVERRGDRYAVIDLGAQNGVYLNGARITGESSLTPGDRIGLGRYVAIFDPTGAEPGRQRRADDVQDADQTGLIQDGHVEVDFDDVIEDVPQEPTEPHGSNGQAQDNGLMDMLESDVGDDVLDIDMGDSMEGGAVQDPGFEDPDFEDPTTAIATKRPPAATIETEAAFVLLYNQLEVSRHLMTGDEAIVGRSKQCEIVISLLGLSRRHARIYREGARVLVEDMGSQNGTWVNNTRIEGARSLEHGDLMNFYEYGLLYLEDGSAEVRLPGAEFSSEGEADVLALQETGQRGPPSREVEAAKPRISTRRNSVALSDAVGSEAASAEREQGDSFDFDALGEGSYLEDAFEDDEGGDGLEDMLDNPATPSSTQVSMENPLDLSDLEAALDSDLERELESFQEGEGTAASADGSAPGFDVDKTAYSSVPRLGDELGRGSWPTDVELEEALARRGERRLMGLEVYLDDDLYTQMPISQDVTRVGTDARCEVALPSAAGLAGWQMTLLRFGSTCILYRASANARVLIDDVAIDQAVMKHGDVIQLGRIKVVFKRR